MVLPIEDGSGFPLSSKRSVTKTGGSMGGSSRQRLQARETPFLTWNRALWLELTEKSRAKVNSGGVSRHEQDRIYDMNIILKYEMEQK